MITVNCARGRHEGFEQNGIDYGCSGVVGGRYDRGKKCECPCHAKAQASRSVESEIAELPVSLSLLEGPLREGGVEVGDLTGDELRRLSDGLRGAIRVAARGLAISIAVNRLEARR